jgi:CRISPR-associated protein Cas4
MIIGMLRHRVFDLFNKHEQLVVEEIKKPLKSSEIKLLYLNSLTPIIQEVIAQNKTIISRFSIDREDLVKSIHDSLLPEIDLRIPIIQKTLERGFTGVQLWKNLSPKYITELKLESQELGLRGRVDRVLISESIMPYEVKTRDKMFDSDKLQLAGYALLLESEFSKKVSCGIIELLGKQQQVDLTSELKSQVLDIAQNIRDLNEQRALMPSNFQKCNNCELRENCS